MRTSGLAQLIGRQVTAVVVAEGDPREWYGQQIFLVLDDRSWFEIYGKPSPASGCCAGGVDEAVAYAMKMKAERITRVEADGREVVLHPPRA